MLYKVHEIVRSIQGEGARIGIPTTFLRFSGCNLNCPFCDTKEHTNGRDMSLQMILDEVEELGSDVVSLCGGEPALQVDNVLVRALHALGAMLTIETNGTLAVAEGIDYVVVSPKVGPSRLIENFSRPVAELKYIVEAGCKIPVPLIAADNYFLSPAYDGDRLVPENVRWAVHLIEENTGQIPWRLNVQAHKAWGLS